MEQESSKPFTGEKKKDCPLQNKLMHIIKQYCKNNWNAILKKVLESIVHLGPEQQSGRAGWGETPLVLFTQQAVPELVSLQTEDTDTAVISPQNSPTMWSICLMYTLFKGREYLGSSETLSHWRKEAEEMMMMMICTKNKT